MGGHGFKEKKLRQCPACKSIGERDEKYSLLSISLLSIVLLGLSYSASQG
jgi:hypothetical protein